MKRFFSLMAGLMFATVAPSRADVSLVFNEIMYHPVTNEPALEWLELYNQMAVDIDISSWSLDGTVQYRFAPGTVVHGGSFVVVAASPTNLTALTGLTNVFGPFTNRLSNSGAQLLLRNNYGRPVSEVDYGVSGGWAVAPDGSGVSLAKLDHGAGSFDAVNWNSSAQIGGTPGRENFPSPPAPLKLAFNEVSATTDTNFWVELMNFGTNTLALDNFVIVRDGLTNGEYVLSPGTSLPAGGFLTFSNSTLGFHPIAGDKLYLLPAARTNVLDAIVLKSSARGRWPDGSGAWLKPTVATPGASNNFVFHREVVINEIMYDHQLLPATNNLPPQASDEAWVELYNAGTNAVDLTGWELSGGISFGFPAGKTITAGAYLVVAANSAALRLAYPAVDIVGDFKGKLSHNGDSVVLEDAAGNPASNVRYYPGGRWPELAAGGGSSLELRDPRADASSPGAWATSDESAKTSWQTYTYQGVAQTVVGPNQWNDFLMGMLTSGECLVDDISVIESPTGAAVQFIANGNFESGATGWRFLGNHMQSRVEPEPGNPGNHVLHVIAGGPQEDLHNHIETTYTAGRKVTDGRTYQISFRAKWLAGNNLFNTRLYYDKVAKTTALPTPSLNGTPGAQNSCFCGNIGPTFSQLQHAPIVPPASQAVTVSVVAQDPQGVGSCEVWWSANGAAFSHAAMAAQGAGRYSGNIPGFAAGSIVQFYVQATDTLGAISTYPAASSNSGALYMVNDGQSNLNRGHNFRVILSPSNWGLLRATTNLMSSGYLPCTMIYDEQRPYYDLLVRLKGSESGRVGDPKPSFHLVFQPDDLFKGVHSSILLDTSGRPGNLNQQEEILVHHMANHAGGIPDIHQDMCRVIPPYSTNTSSGVAEPRFEDEFISTAFANGSSGTEWVMEITYYPTSTNSAGYKLPSPQGLMGPDIMDLGSDKETYRYNFLIKNHRSEDDYSRFIPFAKTLSMTNGPILEAQSKQVMDMDEWLRVYALVSLVGESDWYTFGYNHNIILYNRPEDNRMLVFPWDVEQLFLRPASSPLIGNPANFTDLENVYPANKRRLYAHALDIIASTFNTTYMGYWAAHYASFAPPQDFSDLLSYIPQRTAAVQAEINAAGGNAPFAINGTNFIVTANNLVTFTGTAPVQIQSLLINGVAYPLTWTSVSSWSLRLPVNLATNVLNFTALDLNGKVLTNFSGTVTVNYTAPPPSPAASIVINEIQYNPLLPDASYVELYNSSTTAGFDLSNWQMNGLGYTFPPGTTLTNRQYLLLVKDRSAFINAYGVFIPPFDEFDGNLQTNGETLTLIIPAAQTNLPGTVVDKVKYSASLPWAQTVPGNSLQLRDPAQDNFRAGNWGTAPGTPGKSNSVGVVLPAFQPLWINEVQAENVTGVTNSAGQHTPWVELFNPTTNTVSLAGLYLSNNYTNLTAWPLPSAGVINPGQFKLVFVDGQVALSTTNEPHANFTLSPGAGSVALSRIFNSQTQVLDFVDYTNLAPNRSYGSAPDAQIFDRQAFFYVTPRGSNNPASAPLSVVINEWMAGNTNTLVDPVTGKYEDWFELYNYGTNAADVGGYYLTHSLTNQTEFLIPAGYTIPPQGFLLVWADKKSTNGTPDLHANFKLSKAGTSIGLYGADGVPIDYITFGAQTSNISMGRYPDGADAIYFMPSPTPHTNNVIPNSAPVLGTLTNWLIHAGQTVHFTATATDAEIAFQTLNFSLDSGAPAGATIGSVGGDFLWTTTGAPVPSTNIITVRVTDDGSPPLSSAGSFSVTVLAPPQLGGLRPSGGLLPLTFGTLPGQRYQIQYKSELSDPSWIGLNSPIMGNGTVMEIDDDMSGHTQRFYRLAVLP